MITNELRVGVKIKDKVLKDFKLKTLKIAQLKEINNDDYRKDNPIRWLGKTLCILLESIEGESCAMVGRDFPEVIKKLSLIDVSYVLIAGHTYNLGSEIKGLKITCNCDRRQEIGVELDLQNLITEEDYPTPDEEFLVTLPHGVTLSLPNLEDVNLKDKVWKHLTFRMPVLGDMLKNEKHFSPSAKSEFGEKIIAACLTSCESEDGTQLPPQFIKMFGDKLIIEMTARDMQAVSREFNKFPTHRIFCETNCTYCDRELSTPVEPNFLFIAA